MSSPPEIAIANGKLGGRPSGAKNKLTIMKEKALAHLQTRIVLSVDSLFNAAKSSALGNSFLYKIITHSGGQRSKPQLVTDPEEISEYLDRLDRENRGEHGETEEDDDTTYYFIATKDPDVRAFTALTDRVFGRTTENKNIKVSLPKPIMDLEEIEEDVQENNSNEEGDEAPEEN